MDEKSTHLSATDVALLIAQGQPIVIHEGYALQLDTWMDKHPGGKLAILHMVGRDATDEINAYHQTKALLMMKRYRIGRVQEPWTNTEPPIRSPHYRERYLQSKVKTASGVQRSPFASIGPSAPTVVPCAKQSDATRDVPGQKCCRRTSPALVDVDVDSEKQDTPQCETATKKEWLNDYTEVIEAKEVADNKRDWPALDEVTQRAITMEYRKLHQQIKDEGLYTCHYSKYAEECVRYGALFCTFLYFLHIQWYLTSAVFLGCFWQQIMFTAHDAGHRGITGNFVVDTLIGCFVGNFCCGLSIGWWKSSHNVHHLITNMPEHDPDLQNVPLFATSPTYMKSVFSTFYNFEFLWDAAADFLVPYQKYTYYPIMGLARFNLYLLSWLHLFSPRAAQLGSAQWTRSVELLFMTCYWIIFGYGLVWKTLPNWPVRIAFVLISHWFTMLLHVQITLSHWGMPTADLGPTESFPMRQLRTTMDVDCPEWLDFLHGGLQYQAVHHLFPRVPRHNLRKVQALVRVFAEKTQLTYHCYGFVEGNQVVLGRLAEVGKMVDMMVKCQLHMAETGESGLH